MNHDKGDQIEMSGYWYGPFQYTSYLPVRLAALEGYDERMKVVLRMLQEGIAGERRDELLYDFLIEQAPTEQEKQVIAGIRDDERRHRRLFLQIYGQLTGQRPAAHYEIEALQPPVSYLDGIEQALFGELKTFERYRTIYKYMLLQYRDTVFEIMTDELKHASYYNWLYARNR
ncbi:MULTISPECIES: ferritin-like domain-containing protein [Brevibacillus]|uniref:ferritin-like domain-containing protein n=2 Tax=Brevibacillus TaxID=55080 RepID=UPI0028930D37|nr:ferritin-like domain-containing protein [Brevibacillus aydinogluensis]MDT3417080.1 rubrerythrin [Brevibacillus aydinogluensis]